MFSGFFVYNKPLELQIFFRNMQIRVLLYVVAQDPAGNKWNSELSTSGQDRRSAHIISVLLHFFRKCH